MPAEATNQRIASDDPKSRLSSLIGCSIDAVDFNWSTRLSFKPNSTGAVPGAMTSATAAALKWQ